MPESRITLDEAVATARTGDIWIFRGNTLADRAIQTLTNSPVNHVGMTLVLDDLPPLVWHAEMGRTLPDLWTGTRHRGAQLHDLRDAVLVWCNRYGRRPRNGTPEPAPPHRYGQRAWLRQLDHQVPRDGEDAALHTIARLSGTPFPSTSRLAGRWLTGRVRRHRARDAALETAYCAEIVAVTYTAMGLLPADRRPNWYDPGSFWSGDDLPLLGGARLGAEIAVDVPPGLPAGVPPPR